MVTLLVDDLDAWDGEAEDIPGVGRQKVHIDPDGNRVVLAQVPADA
jgi:hypothetical protein